MVAGSAELQPTEMAAVHGEKRTAEGADEADASDLGHTAPPPKRQRQRASHGGSAPQASQCTEVVGPHARPSVLEATEVGGQARRVSLTSSVRNLARERENGALLTIKLLHFKSHKSFELHFGPRLNLIVGKNGTRLVLTLPALCLSLVRAVPTLLAIR